MNKTVIILRAVSGSGKSTFANYIASLDKSAVVCCADDYFELNGEYKFNPNELGTAHAACLQKFKYALRNDLVNTIIVANTNTTEREIRPYLFEARKFNAIIHFVVLENRHGGNDVHGVPEGIKDKQKNRLLASLKL